VSKSAWGLAVVSLLVWIPILPFTQPQQWIRWKSETLIETEDFEALSKLTLDYPETDFPSHWDPPPRIAYNENEPNPHAALVALNKHGAAPWMLEHYVRKIKDGRFWRGYLGDFSDQELATLVEAFALLPDEESQQLADEMKYSVRRVLEPDHVEEDHPEMSEARRASIEKLVSMMSAENQAVLRSQEKAAFENSFDPNEALPSDE